MLEADGLMHACTNELELARAQLEAAASVYRKLGARMDLERAEQEIAALISPTV
jgi:hypothetical protein